MSSGTLTEEPCSSVGVQTDPEMTRYLLRPNPQPRPSAVPVGRHWEKMRGAINFELLVEPDRTDRSWLPTATNFDLVI